MNALDQTAKDGGYYWVFTTIVPFMTDKGHPYQYVSIRTDITEQKLSHELGNPLAAGWNFWSC